MKNFVETERLVLHRFIFEDGTLFQQMQKKHPHSSALALAALIKKNKQIISGIFGWWSDISSPYSAGFHIKEDEKRWRHEQQFQYYLYDKKSEKCIGIFCALIENNQADVLVWLSDEGQRNGYAAEASKVFEKELFLTQGIDLIQYKCYQHNPNKQRVAAFLKVLNYTVPFEKGNAFVWQKSRREFLLQNGFKETKIQVANQKVISFFKRMKMALGLVR